MILWQFFKSNRKRKTKISRDTNMPMSSAIFAYARQILNNNFRHIFMDSLHDAITFKANF